MGLIQAPLQDPFLITRPTSQRLPGSEFPAPGLRGRDRAQVPAHRSLRAGTPSMQTSPAPPNQLQGAWLPL